jgi:hypothetical protein
MLEGATALGSTNTRGANSSSHRWSILLGGAIIALAALAAYHNCFSGPFVFDDLPSICDNQTIRHVWPIWDALSPSAASLVGGRPTVNLSFAINYALGDTVGSSLDKACAFDWRSVYDGIRQMTFLRQRYTGLVGVAH